MGDRFLEPEGDSQQSKRGASLRTWQRWVTERLPVYGHRNWVVVADAAYPAQSKAGIDTFALDLGQKEVIGQVLASLRIARHVRPHVYLDSELAFVTEVDAPGMTDYRKWLHEALDELIPTTLPHEEIIAKLDHAAETFCVTIFKTTMTIPYSSIFLELDCDYWNTDAEVRLRKAMG